MLHTAGRRARPPPRWLPTWDGGKPAAMHRLNSAPDRCLQRNLRGSAVLHFVAVRGSPAAGQPCGFLPPALSSSSSRSFCLLLPSLSRPSRPLSSPFQLCCFPSPSLLWSRDASGGQWVLGRGRLLPPRRASAWGGARGPLRAGNR